MYKYIKDSLLSWKISNWNSKWNAESVESTNSLEKPKLSKQDKYKQYIDYIVLLKISIIRPYKAFYF